MHVNVHVHCIRTAAYHTLKDCAEQKGVLSAKIESTNESIRLKRKQLEGIREELRILGESIHVHIQL